MECSRLSVQVSIMASLRHPNVVMFMGMCVEPPCIITEFCARGSLFDVLRKARTSPAFAQQLDWSRRLSMALDAAKVYFPCPSSPPLRPPSPKKGDNRSFKDVSTGRISSISLSHAACLFACHEMQTSKQCSILMRSAPGPSQSINTF